MKAICNRLLIAAMVMLICGTAFASIKSTKVFNDLYKPADGTALKKAKCLSCHLKPNGKGGTNAYGKQFGKKKDLDAAALRAVENKDPDKDGASNIAEIKAGTLPGDAKSKPPKK